MNKAFTEEQLTNIREALKSWEKLTFDQINASSGFGLCNFTYVVKALDPEVQPPAVFYREFGDMMGAKDHEEENQIFKAIAKIGLGPQCYYANNKYRIEEYIPSKVLRPNEANTPIISNSVAKWLAGLHKQNFDFLGLDKTRTVTLNKIDSQNLIKKAKEVLDTTTFTGEDKEITDLLKNKVTEEEFNSLKEMLPKSDKAIVFCHNDPNLGNIIKAEGTGEVIVVDYENCGYNYRGVDIGAYFTLCRVDLAYPEPPFINVDYTKFSTDEEMKAFIRRYLLFFRYDWSTIDEEKALVDDEYLKKYVTKHDNLEDFEAEVDEILRESFIGAMICQMFATVAVVVMDIKLPYSKYEMCRASYKSYMEFKAKAKTAPVKA